MSVEKISLMIVYFLFPLELLQKYDHVDRAKAA